MVTRRVESIQQSNYTTGHAQGPCSMHDRWWPPAAIVQTHRTAGGERVTGGAGAGCSRRGASCSVVPARPIDVLQPCKFATKHHHPLLSAIIPPHGKRARPMHPRCWFMHPPPVFFSFGKVKAGSPEKRTDIYRERLRPPLPPSPDHLFRQSCRSCGSLGQDASTRIRSGAQPR